MPGPPGWAAALITAVLLGGLAYALRNAARPSAPRPAPGAAAGTPGGPAVPPKPPVAPSVPGTDAPAGSAASHQQAR